MTMTKKAKAAAAKRVDKAYLSRCSGIQIPIMEIQKIHNIGLAAIAEGVDDETLAQRIFDYVQTIREN